SLLEIISGANPATGGVIARTACQNLTKKDIVDDIRGLEQIWTGVQAKSPKTAPPALLHADLDLVLRSVRDMLSPDVDQIAADTEADFRRTKDYVGSFLPALAERVEYYDQSEPILDRFGVEEQIARAIEPK